MRLAVIGFALVPALAVAAPKLVKVKHEGGATIMTPKGWETDVGPDSASSRSSDGKAELLLTLEAGAAEDVDKQVTHGFPAEKAPKLKKSNGWTCGHGTFGEGEQALGYGGACAKLMDGVVMLVTLNVDDEKLWRQLGGISTVQKIAASAKGFAIGGMKKPDDPPPVKSIFKGSTGFPACDQYLNALARCFNSMPSMNEAAKKDAAKGMKQAWNAFKSVDTTNPTIRKATDDACQQMNVSLKEQLKQLGCTP